MWCVHVRKSRNVLAYYNIWVWGLIFGCLVFHSKVIGSSSTTNLNKGTDKLLSWYIFLIDAGKNSDVIQMDVNILLGLIRMIFAVQRPVVDKRLSEQFVFGWIY